MNPDEDKKPAWLLRSEKFEQDLKDIEAGKIKSIEIPLGDFEDDTPYKAGIRRNPPDRA